MDYYFKKNFEIVGNLLNLLESDLKLGGNSKIEEIDVKIKDINRQISNLYEFSGVRNKVFFNDIPSKILNSDMKKSLYKMLDRKRLKFVLIHDQTKGKNSVNFDNAVRCVGPTLIVIQATTGHVFGAYVHDTFGNPGGWVRGSEQTFIFSLKNIYNTPIKLLHNGSGNGIHITSCGLHLSNDLVAFCSHSCSPSVYTKIAPGYINVPVSNTLLAGEPNYTPQHMEVFSVSNL